ncbi:MAG: hypothetical protein GZ094_14445 [Mariniphaga sp.]|nr:hypothetical protein [Mariniphaga sp.]
MVQLSHTYKARISVGGVDISLFKSIVLEKVMIEDQNQDTMFYIGSVKLQIDSLALLERRVHFGDLNFEDSKINILKDTTGYNFQFLAGSSTSKPDTLRPWNITFTNFYFLNSRIKYKDINAKDTLVNHGMNFDDIDITKLNLSVVNVRQTDSITTFFVDNASVYEKSGFSIGDLRFAGRIDSTGLELSNMTLVSNHSHIEANRIKISKNKLFGIDSLYSEKSLTLTNRYVIDSDFKESMLSLTDLSYVIPEIWGMNEPILFSGGIKGSLSNLKFKRINFKIGRETQLNADLELQGLPNWKNTFIFFKLYNNTFNFNDLAAVRMPDSAPLRYLKIPKELLNNVRFTYQGNFSGFPSDFVAYGTLDGSFGKLSTDIAIRPKKSGEIDFKGNIKALSFEAGKLLNYAPLGAVSLEIKVNGSRSENNKFNALIAGNIDSLYFNNYRVDSIYVNGEARDRSFEGELDIKDNNLKMNFAGKADFAGKIPEFNFTSTVERANLVILGLEKEKKVADLKFQVSANFTGDHIDNVNGQIDLRNFKFVRDDKILEIQSLIMKTSNSVEKNNISLQSDVADLTINGKYHFGELDLTIRDYLQYFLPSAKLPFSDRPSTGKNAFQFDVNIKKTEELGSFFIPGLVAKSPVILTGNINSEKKTLSLDGSVDELLFNQYQVRGLTINSRNIGNKWLIRIGTKNAVLGGNLMFENFSINNSLVRDSLNTAITWNNNSVPTSSGKIDFMGIFSRNREGKSLADFYLRPSKIWVADSLWQIEKSHLHIDTTSIAVDNFTFRHNQEYFSVFGKVTDNTSDKINVEFNKVKLSNIDLLLGEEIGIFGELNGTVSVADPYHSFALTSNLKVSDFTYLEKNFGDILLDNTWDQEKLQLNSSLVLMKDSKAGLEVKGYYKPKSDSLEYHANFKDYPLESLLPILQSFSNKVEGIGNGQVSITGKLSAPKFNGKVAVTNAKIGIDYTKVVYSLSDTVRFSGDSIIFKNISVSDVDNNKARFNGVITHNLFNHMTYDMFASTSNIMALNTTGSDNPLFYGIAHASGMIRISGKVARVRLDMSLTTRPGTQINVPLENPESVNQYDFIRFVNPDSLVQKDRSTARISNSGGFEMNLDLTTTPDAKVQMIFNSTVGDAINGYGSGDLRFNYDKDGNFFIYGDYKIDKGDYMFTLQNVLVRKFRIDQGGLISWNGDPYGAIVELDAVYTLKAPVNYLLINSNQNDKTRRIPVECRINLSKKLLNPAVKFDIAFPTADERTKDELQQFISTQDDINRQMVSLLVMGQFFTPEYLRGRQDFQSNTGNLVGSTTSDILSNQLSNWLSQISNEWDIGFNYRPGDLVNANQMELALSTQILNDRVKINGNIGNNSNLQSNIANPVVGEVEVFIKLNKSGKLQLKAYNRANDDLIYDTSLYKQGIGFSFTEEFDTLSDLFKHYRSKKTLNKVIIKQDTLKGQSVQ